MIQTTDKRWCSGCSACAEICPHGAITMQPDTLGFLYPTINKELCTDCGLCNKVCSFHTKYDIAPNFESPEVYGVRHKSIGELEKSRSGAFFVALSDEILSHGGVVYGVGYTDDTFREVTHKRATTPSQRDEFRGSKYIQSDMSSSYALVKADLDSGTTVLFTGTPCQTSALRSYLKLKRTDSTHLILCDIACYGVPSQRVWSDYLDMVERKRGKKIESVNFRDKSRVGWRGHQESFKFSNGIKFSHSFAHIFKQNIILRHSCGVCPFANFQRPSDITLADFWGWQRVDASFNADDRGVSLVLVNTPKGQTMWQAVNEKVSYITATTDLCTQPSLCRPAIINPRRDELERSYTQLSTEQIFKTYGDMTPKWQIKYALYDIFNTIKTKIKR